MRNITNLLVTIFLLWTVVCVPWTTSFAEPPRRLINYQGRLTDSQGQPITGTRSVTLRIYDTESGGSPLWQETHTTTLDRGIFNLFIGGITPLNLAFDKQYWLGIQVGGDTEMSPRQLLASSAYAFKAENVTGVVPIANGGTGQTSANNALNALLPGQSGNSGKVLGTDGSNPSWGTVSIAGWVKIYDGIMSGGDIVISGLDGNADKFYKIFISGNYNNSHIYVQMNNDTSVGNYPKISCFRNFAQISSPSVAGMMLLVNNEQYGNGYSLIEATIGAASGHNRVCIASCSSDNLSDRHMGIEVLVTQWKNTADNITQMVIKGNFTGRVTVFAVR